MIFPVLVNMSAFLYGCHLRLFERKVNPIYPFEVNLPIIPEEDRWI